MLSELLGLELPWSDYDVRFVPPIVVNWSSTNVDDSLASTVLDQAVARAISPRLSNFLLECLWVRASRRPSIRELKMHPFLSSSSISKTIRGRWVVQPSMHCTQLRHHQHTLTRTSDASSNTTKGHHNKTNTRHGVLTTNSSVAGVPAGADSLAVNYELQRLLQHAPSSSSSSSSCTTAPPRSSTPHRRHTTPQMDYSNSNSRSPLSILFQLDANAFKVGEEGGEGLLSGAANINAAAVAAVATASGVFSSTDSAKNNGLERMAILIMQHKQVVHQQVDQEIHQPRQSHSTKKNHATNNPQNKQNPLFFLKRERQKELKKETHQLRESLATILLEEGCATNDLRATVWCVLLAIDPRTSTWSYPPLLRKAASLVQNISAMQTETKDNHQHENVEQSEEERADTLAVQQLLNQLSKDIPRCHSYHTELSRPLYARRFVRVLTSWTMAKKERMYWQGMDSMCAPILLLYQNEALACKCCSSQVWCVSMSINECGGVVAWCYCVVCCFDTHLTMFFFVIHQVLYWKK